MSDLMGERVIKKGRELEAIPATLVFDLAGCPQKISLLEELRGKRGWLWLDKLSLSTFEETETLIFTACDANGALLPREFGEKLFGLPAKIEPQFSSCPFASEIDAAKQARIAVLVGESEKNNHHYFEEELDKLDRWAADLKTGLELELKQLDRDINEADRQSKRLISLAEKLAFQKQKAALEKRRSQKRHELFVSQDKVDARREELINQLEKQLRDSKHEVVGLFCVGWRLG